MPQATVVISPCSSSGEPEPAFCRRKVSGPVGVLARPRLLAGLAVQGGLLVAGHPADGHATAELARVAVDVGVGARGGQRGGRHAEQVAQLLVPAALGVVLDPARPGEVLLELGVRPAPRPSLLVEDQARRAGRALVDGQDHRVTSGSSGVPGGPKPELKSW
jgi:hypothetical protein